MRPTLLGSKGDPALHRRPVPSTDPLIRVVVVDNQTLFREGLLALIRDEPDIQVVGQATSLEAVADIDAPADVVVTDLAFPGVDCDRVIERIRARFESAAIVVLTASDDLGSVRLVLAAGADGYVLKSAGITDLLAGIRSVARGSLYLQSSIGIAFASRPADDERPAIGGLTPKETNVLRLLALGHTNSEIARLVGASLRTVETHRAHIHQKLDLHSRAQLVRYALDTGLLRVDEAGSHAPQAVVADVEHDTVDH